MGNATPTWTLVNSYIFRQPERVYFNPYKPDEVWVSSFGNGMKMGSLNNTTGIATEISTGIALYPNPSHGAFSLQIPASIQGNIDVQILGIAGRILQRTVDEAAQNIAVRADGLASGMYVLRLRWAGGSWSGRMIVE